MSSRILDRDRGLGRLLERARGIDGVKITVGVHAEQAAERHPSGNTVGTLAALIELGTDKRAPTGFIRQAIDERRTKLGTELAHAGAAVLRGEEPAVAFGPISGELAAAARARVPVDTGTLRDSVQARVNGEVVG